MSLFDGVQSFSPALEGQRIAIGAGAAMRQGLQGIEDIGRMSKMKNELDKFSNALNQDFIKHSGNPNWESGSMYSPDNFGD